MSSNKKIIKKKRIWTSRDESFLYELWLNKIDALRGARKNSHILEEMRVELEAMGGILVTREEIKTKLHNLTTRYRKEKDKVGISGGSPSSWEMYPKIHGILCAFKVNNLKDIVEESICDNTEDSFSYAVEVLLDDSQTTTFQEISLNAEESSSSSMDLPSTSQEPPAVTSTANTKNKNRDEFLKTILNKINCLEEREERDRVEASKWEEKLYELEMEKKKILEKMAKDNEEVKSEILKYLKRMNNS